MKARLSTLKLFKRLVVLCNIAATTAVFAQTTYVWTNQNPALLTSGDLNRGANWVIVGTPAANRDANGIPRPDFTDGITWGDEMLFDGRTIGPLVATQNGGSQANGGGSGQPYGLRVHLTSNQTNSVTIISPVGTSGGMRMNSFTIDAGSGGLVLGVDTNVLDLIGGVLNGQICGFTNNSSAPSVINPGTRWRLGGAGFHPFIFAGTGDWIFNSHMRGVETVFGIQKEGPGTITWYGTNVGPQSANWFAPLGSPVRINAGTVIVKTSDLLDTSAGSFNIVHNGTLLKYDVQPIPGYLTGPATIAANISGTGPIQINAGVVTFTGANTFTGAINLTGGELIAGSTENVGVSGPLGQGGIISFNGGTLGWNLANAFDYSSRFDTAAGQQYKFDTGGSSPIFATGLMSSGGSLTKSGGGTLTLAGANTYSGTTFVSIGGALLFKGTMSGTGAMTIADGASLGVVEIGSQIKPSTLTLGTSTGAILEFNNVTNHTTATLAPSNLVSAGPVTINVNSGQFFFIGETFPLLSWTSGSAPAVALGFMAGAGGHLTTNGNEIDLVIDDPPYIWIGAADLFWNTFSIDWTRSGIPVAWVNGRYALFDDSAGPNANVTMSGIIMPVNTTINSTSPYSINNSAGNALAGGGSLTKNGSGRLTLPGGANTYSGVTTISGGVLAASVLANGSVASDIGAASSAATNIVLDGGTLQYIGSGVGIDRLFSVGPSGGTIDSQGAAALVFNNSGSLGMSGNGPRTLTLTGANNFGDTIASAIVNHPAGTSLTKNGPGTWILTGTNTYANGSTILGGTLHVGAGGASGTVGSGNISTASGTGIDFKRTGTLTILSAISGGAGVTNDGTGTVILANNNSYSGGTFINAGTLQVGNGSGTGSLLATGPIVNNGLLVFNTTGTFTYGSGVNGIISGSGNVVVQGGGFIKAIGNNTYSGWTRIDPATTFQPIEGQAGGLLSSAVTNNGTLRLVSQATFSYSGPIVGSGRLQIGANNFNVGVITLTGANTYTGGTFIGANTLVLGDGFTPVAGSIAGNVQFVNNFTFAQDNPRTISFNRPDDFTFGGTITTNFTTPQFNQGVVQQNGTGRLTLTGNNTYAGGTVINAGILQVGAGGATGTLGSGNVTDHSQLVFNRTGTLTIGTVTGVGSITNLGSGTVTLTGNSSVFGGVDLLAGTFGAAPFGTIGSLSMSGNLTIASGVTVLAGLNRSSSPSNSVYTVGGIINHSGGGILKLINAGPLLQVGDKFFIFNQAVPNNVAILSPGFTVQNDLGTDGSVTVTDVAPAPTISTTIGAGGLLTFTWPTNWIGGVHLQTQVNPITKGLSTNWVTIAGTDATNVYTTSINKTNGTVFYRLISP
jgi:autotransporter-associated beta strand protein